MNGEKVKCPAEFKKHKCQVEGVEFKKYKVHKAQTFHKEDNIKAEIMANGPLETGFTVYEDFLSYSSGIYDPTSKKNMGGHAVKIIGWGEEEGTKFWLVANSWGSRWGEEGFFRIKIGTSGFAKSANGGKPVTDGVC
jgi:cathepsin B